MHKSVALIVGLFFTTLVNAATFTLQSKGLTDGQKIPPQYTCNKGDISPELHWTNAPQNTKAFALVAKGLDSPMGEVYGWVLYNIPVNVTEFPEAINTLPDGTMVAKNSLGTTDYRGPCPPDSKLHHYEFVMYALGSKLDVSSDDDIKDIIREIKEHAVAQAELKCVFSH